MFDVIKYDILKFIILIRDIIEWYMINLIQNAQVSNDSCVGMKLETDLREGEYINYTT